MKICDFDFIFLCIIVLILIFIYDQLKSIICNKENFQSTTTGYQADIEAIRNLSNIATKLQEGGLTVPGTLNVTSKLLLGKSADGTSSTITDSVYDQNSLCIVGQGNYPNRKVTIWDNVDVRGNTKIQAKLATNGLDPNNIPDGWGGGIRTNDVYGSGTIACGPDGKQINAYINRDGNAYFAGNTKIQAKLATNGLDPNNIPDGWGGGIRTNDIYGSGTIACGPDGKQINAYINRDGNAYFAGNVNINGTLKIGNWTLSGLDDGFRISYGNFNDSQRFWFIKNPGQRNFG